MKSAFKPFILCFLTVAILFTMVSCEWKSGPPKDSIQEGTDTGAVTTITDTPLDVFTSSEPELTIPEETTSAIILDETTPEPIVPQETTPGVQNSQESVPDYTTPKETTTSEEIKTPE